MTAADQLPPSVWERIPDGWLVALIAFIVIFGYGGGKSILEWAKNRNAAPVEAKAAQLAVQDTGTQKYALDAERAANLAQRAWDLAESAAERADAAEQTADGVRRELRTERTERETERDAARSHSRTQDRAIERLERHVQTQGRWIDNVKRNWATVRLLPSPPSGPLLDAE